MTIPENVTILDDCNDNDLALLYKYAKGLINCSVYEGFGLPLIEAMASGCPLIVSDIPVFKEIGGNNAIYFDPTSSDSIVDAIAELINKNPKALDVVIKNSHLSSFRFSWAESSAQLIALTHNLLPHINKQVS